MERDYAIYKQILFLCLPGLCLPARQRSSIAKEICIGNRMISSAIWNK